MDVSKRNNQTTRNDLNIWSYAQQFHSLTRMMSDLLEIMTRNISMYTKTILWLNIWGGKAKLLICFSKNFKTNFPQTKNSIEIL